MSNIKVRKSRQTDLIAETAERSVPSAHDRTTIQTVDRVMRPEKVSP